MSRLIIYNILILVFWCLIGYAESNSRVEIALLDRLDNPSTVETNKNLLQLLKQLREKSGLSKLELPIFVFHRDKSEHFLFTNQYFHITDDALPAVVLYQKNDQGKPASIIYEKTNITSPSYEAEKIFKEIRNVTGRSEVVTTLTTSTLKITSEPSGAYVKIDNEDKGVTPLTVELSPGSYNVSIRASDGQLVQKEITLENSESKEISFIIPDPKQSSLSAEKEEPKIQEPPKIKYSILPRVYAQSYYDYNHNRYVNFRTGEILFYISEKLKETGIFEVVTSGSTQYEIIFDFYGSSKEVRCVITFRDAKGWGFDETRRVSMPAYTFFSNYDDLVTKRAKNLAKDIITQIAPKVEQSFK